jgi:hypothetical protein
MKTLMGPCVQIALLALAVTAGVAMGEPAGAETPDYVVASETGLRGVVAEVRTHASAAGYRDLHLVVTTSNGPMEVHIGPASFVSRRGFEFARGDDLTIIGSLVTWRGVPAVVVRQVMKGTRTLVLRSVAGRPAWPKTVRD